MKTDDLALERFAETWLAEFRRAIERVSGQTPQIRHTRVESNSMPDGDSAWWVKQCFVTEDGAGFTSWVGAPDAAWRDFGDSFADAAPDALRSRCIQILKDAQPASASLVSGNSANVLRCEEPQVFDIPGFDADRFAIYECKCSGGAAVPSLWFAVEFQAAGFLASYEWELPQNTLAPETIEKNPSASLGSLLHLKLPVSISLGRRELELKKVLAAGPGSVIALNKETGEPVELLVGGRVVAVGEIVLVKGNYGLRIKQIVDRGDRLRMCRDA